MRWRRCCRLGSDDVLDLLFLLRLVVFFFSVLPPGPLWLVLRELRTSLRLALLYSSSEIVIFFLSLHPPLLHHTPHPCIFLSAFPIFFFGLRLLI